MNYLVMRRCNVLGWKRLGDELTSVIMINWCSDKLIYCEFFMHLWESWKYANAQNVHDIISYIL